MSNMLTAAWSYRGFIYSSIKNEFRARVSRSKLGGMWSVIHPLIQVLMYALVLSAVLSAKLPGIDNRFAYAIYLTAGMLAWSLFSEVLSSCLTIFINNGNTLKKVMFPKITLPMIASGVALVNNVLLFLAILVIFALLGHLPGVEVIWIPLLFIVSLAFGLGFGLVFGILNVFMRDLGQLIPVLLQFGFWFTPIVYPSSIIPEAYRGWLELNPMYYVVSAFQDVLAYHRSPDVYSLIFIALFSVALMIFALVLFRKAHTELVDAL